MSDKKLCKWYDKALDKEIKTYWKMVKSPKFLCKKCGRAANKKDNLCKPISVK